MPLSNIEVFRRKPRIDYSGLTIVLSNPSRFDFEQKRLLAGMAGSFFLETCLRGGVNLAHDFRIAEDKSPLLDGTKTVLMLGSRAMDDYVKSNGLIDKEITLNEQRGSPIIGRDGIVYIASYQPQDTFDIKSDYEREYNQYLVEGERGDDSEDDEDSKEDDAKTTHGKTKRKNWRFWLQKDTQKILRILDKGLSLPTTPVYNIYPDINQVINELRTNKNTDFYFDIETDSEYNLTCIGFAFGDGDIFVVPIYRYDYSLAYDWLKICELFSSLSIAFRDNTTVIHNSLFDLFIMVWRYRIPIGFHAFDTMLSHHRNFPEVEKSLGHTISLYTDLPYHKNEGVFEPHNVVQEQQLWEYNGKDIFSMREVKKGILKHAEKIKSLESIQQVNKSIVPYLSLMLTGIRFNNDMRTKKMADNDKRMMEILRLLKYLVGYDFLPTSPKQCVDYFHNDLGFSIVGKSKRTGKPSLDEKNMMKLYVRNDHPVIPLCLEFRRLSKETGSLKFNPWRTPSI